MSKKSYLLTYRNEGAEGFRLWKLGAFREEELFIELRPFEAIQGFKSDVNLEMKEISVSQHRAIKQLFGLKSFGAFPQFISDMMDELDKRHLDDDEKG